MINNLLKKEALEDIVNSTKTYKNVTKFDVVGIKSLNIKNQD